MSETQKAGEVVAWLHPTAGWAHANFHEVRNHCSKAGPQPVPLVRQSALSQALTEIKRLQEALETAIQMSSTASATALEQIARAEAAEARATVSEAKPAEVSSWNEFTKNHLKHFPYPDGTQVEVSGFDSEYRQSFSRVMRVRSPEWRGYAPYIAWWRLPALKDSTNGSEVTR